MADVQVKNSKLYLEMISKYNEQSIILKQAEPIKSSYFLPIICNTSLHVNFSIRYPSLTDCSVAYPRGEGGGGGGGGGGGSERGGGAKV